MSSLMIINSLQPGQYLNIPHQKIEIINTFVVRYLCVASEHVEHVIHYMLHYEYDNQAYDDLICPSPTHPSGLLLDKT